MVVFGVVLGVGNQIPSRLQVDKDATRFRSTRTYVIVIIKRRNEGEDRQAKPRQTKPNHTKSSQTKSNHHLPLNDDHCTQTTTIFKNTKYNTE